MAHRFPFPVGAFSRAAAVVVAGLMATGLASSQQEPPSPTPPALDEVQAAESVPQPRLQVIDREIDLGTLYRGEKAEARFELRNVGDAVLHIQRVKPG